MNIHLRLSVGAEVALRRRVVLEPQGIPAAGQHGLVRGRRRGLGRVLAAAADTCDQEGDQENGGYGLHGRPPTSTAACVRSRHAPG